MSKGLSEEAIENHKITNQSVILALKAIYDAIRDLESRIEFLEKERIK